MNEERRRARIAEEVAEAEAVVDNGLGQFTPVELEAMNEQLNKLRNEATSLNMPTRRIEQLKLKVASAIGGGPKRGPGPLKGQRMRGKGKGNNPGPRGQEKVEPTGEPAPPPPEPEPEPEGEPLAMVMGACPHCQAKFCLPVNAIVNGEADRCPECEKEFLASESLSGEATSPQQPEPVVAPTVGHAKGAGRKSQARQESAKAKPKPRKPPNRKRAISELFGEG